MSGITDVQYQISQGKNLAKFRKDHQIPRGAILRVDRTELVWQLVGHLNKGGTSVIVNDSETTSENT